ncbi:hypothetical protein [Streptomyces sp. NBC_00582]|uniref:hypothetical protein n=1 Tax=Streptomyces sp. NBC_00582 TaxID=2975783 RepID=UPI002E81FF44|nr:hypothetical protein [Streptomyces sp. NBC_00582]WUB63282.1 hypothetical protein OG852_24205 [Streptomyces sp. NBC_00582]
MARRRGRTGRAATGLRAVVMGVLLCWAVPAPAAVAAPDIPSYAFADDVREARAATGASGAVRLEAGATYKSTLDGGGKAYYRLELDDVSTTYVAVTAIPRAGTTPAVGDGITVSVQDADSGSCSYESATIGAARSPQPVTAWGAREIRPGKGLCQKAGTYYVVVERSDTGTGETAQDPWELELAPVSEPPLARAGTTSTPEAWDSATPAPQAGEPVGRPGGAGFTVATAVGQGVWSDEVVPGETVFYRVPVDWGQQLYAEADLAGGTTSSASGSGVGVGAGSGYVVDALELTLYNPVRAKVVARGTGYGGTQKSAALDPVPPVRYANRYAPTDPRNSLRFAGSYFLVVHLSTQVAEEFGDGPYEVTLRVRLGGTPESGPGYLGRAVPSGIFGADTGELRTDGATTAGDDPVMRAVAVAGLGTGSALLLFLGGWTLTARRRASAQIRASAQNPTA